MGDGFPEVSELNDWDLEPMGTVRCWRVLSDTGLLESPFGGGSGDSSLGISSAAGIGRPFAAATSWFSVQESEWSLRPRQKGAILRSIYTYQKPPKRVPLRTYHQPPNDGLAIILNACVYALCNKKASIHMLITHAPCPLLFSCHPLPLHFPRLPLLL